MKYTENTVISDFGDIKWIWFCINDYNIEQIKDFTVAEQNISSKHCEINPNITAV